MVLELGISLFVGAVFVVIPDQVFVKTEQEEFHYPSDKSLTARLFGP